MLPGRDLLHKRRRRIRHCARSRPLHFESLEARLCLSVLVDNFDDNSTDVAVWEPFSIGTGVTSAEKNQQLEIDLSASSSDDASHSVFQGGYRSVCTLSGDFDVQVDFELLEWPVDNGVRLGLFAQTADQTQSVLRLRFGSPKDFPDLPREDLYLTNFNDSFTLVSTNDSFGTLRLVRSGTQMTGYYGEGSRWVSIHTTETSTENMFFMIAAWSHEYAFNKAPVKVAFDNFVVSQGNIACTPSLTIITHGRAVEGLPFFQDWVYDMGTAVNDRMGSPCDNAEVRNSKVQRAVVAQLANDGDPNAYDPPAESCQHLLLFDWADRSTAADPGAANENDVAGILADLVRKRLSINEKLDIHFIGHSRGSYVVRDVIGRLNNPSDNSRIRHLQMTTLDPQAWGADGDLEPPRNVDWADNYYQTAGSSFPDEGKPLPPSSDPGDVPRINVDLTNIVRAWDGRNDTGDDGTGNHAEVHDWYHWTIDRTDDGKPALVDGDELPTLPSPSGLIRSDLYPFKSWNNGYTVGYYWSPIGGGMDKRPVPLVGSELHFNVEGPEATESTLTSVPNPSPSTFPTEITPPAEFLDVLIGDLVPGEAAELMLYLPPDVTANSYYLYGSPAPGQPEQWYEFLYDDATQTGANITGNVVAVQFVDGQRGDHDLTANGVIVDPGAPVLDLIPWHNRDMPLDIDRDGGVFPVDAIIVINDLNQEGPRELDLTPKTSDRPLLDTSGDGRLSPVDALLVINFLNSRTAAEGEAAVTLLQGFVPPISDALTRARMPQHSVVRVKDDVVRDSVFETGVGNAASTTVASRQRIQALVDWRRSPTTRISWGVFSDGDLEDLLADLTDHQQLAPS